MYTNKELAEAFRVQVDSKTEVSFNRPYLGMSQIGHACSRNLWYYFRWAKKQKLTAKKKRIFSRGSHEESRLLKILEDNGLFIVDTQKPLEDCGGHFRGHLDAILSGFPEIEEEILGEFKTMNEKAWAKIVANGVREGNRSYWAQLQMYMFYAGLKKALFLAVNKNTEELYFELVDIDNNAVSLFQQRALDIILSPVPPMRAFDSPTYFECNWCDYKEICWENEAFHNNCRTCKYSIPGDGGIWECSLQGTLLSLSNQRQGCGSYDCIKA